jgi:peptide/nickel transport system substrate-binding protein
MWASILLALVVAGFGCAGATSQRETEGAAPAPRGPKTLTIGALGEPQTILGFTGQGGSGGGAGVVGSLAHATLTNTDPFEQYTPELAVELPSVERGTWLLRPDGTMQMTWKLRPNVKWHDGAPFTSDDMMFSLALHKDPDLGHAWAATARAMVSATNPDPLTFIVEWDRVDVNALRAHALTPVAKHLLDEQYRTDKQGFVNSSRFTTEFIGLGPYRMTNWERGSHIELVRFDEYFEGRPPFDRVTVRAISDANTMVANMLAGVVELVLPPNIDTEQALELRRRWEGTGNQVRVEAIPRITYLELMMRPEFAKPANGLPVREVRQGLYHAIDRQAITDVVTGGLGPISDSWISPSEPLRRDVEASIVKYPYDTSRALQLLAGAGWTRGSDGMLAHTSGERMDLQLWTNPQTSEKAGTITVDYWKTIGVNATFHVLSAAQGEDREYQSQRPGPLLTGANLDTLLDRYDGRDLASAANRWSGRNRAGFVNPRADQLLDLLKQTVDERERLALHREQLQIFTSEVAMMPLFWEPRPVLALAGVKGDIHPNNAGWNVFTWDKE